MSLETILIGIVGLIATAAGFWFGGRRSGARDTEQKEKVKDYERVIDNLGKREIADTDARSGSAADRLRDEWGRD